MPEKANSLKESIAVDKILWLPQLESESPTHTLQLNRWLVGYNLKLEDQCEEFVNKRVIYTQLPSKVVVSLPLLPLLSLPQEALGIYYVWTQLSINSLLA